MLGALQDGGSRGGENVGAAAAATGAEGGAAGGGCCRAAEAGAGGLRMAEPRRVPFISLSPVRRREGESPALKREPEVSPPEQPPPPPPPPQPEAARPDPLPPPQRDPARPDPPPPQLQPQREPPRPEPPPRQGTRQEPPPPHEAPAPRRTVRLELVLKDPTEESCVEFSYPELLLCGDPRVRAGPRVGAGGRPDSAPRGRRRFSLGSLFFGLFGFFVCLPLPSSSGETLPVALGLPDLGKAFFPP